MASQQMEQPFVKEFKQPGMEYRPEVRWWLAEGFHTDETLKNDIKMIAEAGFGAAEFLAMDEEGADSAHYGWGSEEWVHDTHTVIQEATERGLGASFTSGTNWSNANLPSIKPDDKAASKELDYTVEILQGGTAYSGCLQKPVIKTPGVTRQELVAVVAIRRLGERGGKEYLDPQSPVLLTGNVRNDRLEWTVPPGGEWALFSFWMRGTGETETPSVSVNYAVNYLDRYGAEAIIDYWNGTVLTKELREYIRRNGRVQMYMDSLELTTSGKGNQFWGYHVLDEFKKRRAYDLTPYLPFIVKSDTMLNIGTHVYYYEAEGDTVERIRNDLYQTMTELYMDNMLKPLRQWLHSIGMTLRAEISYGMPFEISLPGKYVDGIETESLEFASQIDSYRNLAGPAHLYHKGFSSETGASMLNYQMGLDFYTQIIFTQFAAGVSRTVLHGYASTAGSEASTAWPGHEGMWPMIAERFGSRQPAYRHYNDWTTMLARYQMLLRQGKPRVDIGILRLDYDFNQMLFMCPNEKDRYEKELMRAHSGLYWKDMGLQDKGYTFDYFAPQILEDEAVAFSDNVVSPDGPAYQALIIYQETLPLSSAKRILAWAKQGLPVLIVNNVTETARPGFDKTHNKAASVSPFLQDSSAALSQVMTEMKTLKNVLEIDSQRKTVEALRRLGVEARAAFAEPNDTVLTCLRHNGNDRILFVYNYMYTREKPFEFSVSIKGSGTPYRVNCWTGDIDTIDSTKTDGRTALALSLMPGEAALILLKGGEQGELLDISHNGSSAATEPGNIIPLEEWNLEVEDWNEGDKQTIVEDRGLGIVTREVYYETKKTRITAGKTRLKPWKDIEAIGPEVSGIGYYSTLVTLPDTWNKNNGAYLRIGSTNGNSAAVFVNGKKGKPYDFNRRSVDVSELLHAGTNEIMVEVASTLNNRLLARHYHENAIKAMMAKVTAGMTAETEAAADFGDGSMSMPAPPPVQDYGMTGEVQLVTYTVKSSG